MTPEVVFIISSEKGKHKRKHAKKKKKGEFVDQVSFRAHIACLQNIQLDWPPTQDQKQFQGGFTSLPGFPCLKFTILQGCQITRSHIIGPISSSFAQNAAYRNIDSRKKKQNPNRENEEF